MDSEETMDPRVEGTPQPPPGSGIRVEEEEGGVRITLPRLYTQGDVIVTALTAAIAVWLAVWLDAMAAGSAVSAFGRAVMGGLALFFGLVAVSQAVPIALPRVIQDRGDRLVLGWQLGVRLLLPRKLPKSRIRSVERFWPEGAAESAAGSVRIRTDRHGYQLGRELDATATAWLEEAVRTLAARQVARGPSGGGGDREMD